MSTIGPVAGWYSDPSNPGGALRWWDGTQWTAHIQPAPGSGPPTVSPYGDPPPIQQAPPMSYGSAPGQFPYQRGQFPQAQGPYGRRVSRGWSMGSSPMGGTFAQRNQASLTATGFAAVYIVIALATHFVLLGIVPALMCVRAFQRKETLAPLALVAALLTIGVAVAAYTGH